MKGWKFTRLCLTGAMIAAVSVASAEPADPAKQAAPGKLVQAAGGYNDSFYALLGEGQCGGALGYIYS
jgi:hypothetical protein